MTTIDATTNVLSADPRPAFADAVALAGSVLAALRPDQFANPTPCAEYNVEALLGHLVFVLQRVTEIGLTGAVTDEGEEVVASVPDGDWVGAWNAAKITAAAAWSDSTILSQLMALPWVTLPGAAVLGMYVSEVTVHTWDLAKATNQVVQFDDAIVSASVDAMAQMLPVDQRQLAPFNAPVPVGVDAPLIDRLVAWTGRQP